MPQSTSPFLTEGTLDVGVRDTYVSNLLLQVGQVKTGVRLESAHVRVLEGMDGAVIGEHDVVASGFVEAGGFGLAMVTALEPAEGAALRERLASSSATATMKVVVEVSVKGAPAGGGVPSTTPVFRFPITVCKGCLVSFASGNDPAIPQRNCAGLLPESERLPCYPGQDEVVPCQLCPDREVCRPSP